MRDWVAFAMGCVFVGTAFCACAENDGATLQLHDGVGGAGAGDGSGGAGDSGGDVGAAGVGPFEPCAEPSANLGNASDLWNNQFEFDFADHTTQEGRVSAVGAAHIDVTTPEGNHTFSWRGSDLGAAFDVGDTVQVTVTRTWDGLFPAPITAVRSSRATAVVVAGMPWMVMSTETGATALLRGLPPELPELVYSLTSCCSARIDGRSTTRCDYSALEAKHDGTSTWIQPGDTAQVGAWSVSNVRSTYLVAVEHQWDIQVTLLGPATSPGFDGGL